MRTQVIGTFLEAGIRDVATTTIPVGDPEAALLRNHQLVQALEAALVPIAADTEGRGPGRAALLATVCSAGALSRIDLEGRAGPHPSLRSAVHHHQSAGDIQRQGVGVARQSAESAGTLHHLLPGRPCQGAQAEPADVTALLKTTSGHQPVVVAGPNAEVLRHLGLTRGGLVIGVEESLQILMTENATVPPHLHHPHLLVASLLILRKMTAPRRKNRALLERKLKKRTVRLDH